MPPVARASLATAAERYQLDAPAAVIASPAPGIGREDARPALHRGDAADEAAAAKASVIALEDAATVRATWTARKD